MKNIIAAAILALYTFSFGAAFAKVTPVNEYKKSGNLGGNPDEIKVNCETYHYANAPQEGAKCVAKMIANNQKCYNCTCDRATYPFSEADCKTDGFAAPSSGSCKENKPGAEGKGTAYSTYYTTCNCASNLRPSSDFVSAPTSAPFAYEGNPAEVTASGNSSLKLTCYDPSKFSCANGKDRQLKPTGVTVRSGGASSLVLTANDDNPFLYYSAKANTTKEVNFAVICVTGVTVKEPLFTGDGMLTRYPCHRYAKGTALHYDQDYKYFNGDCSDEDNCVKDVSLTSNRNICFYFNAEYAPTYNPNATNGKGGVTCNRVIGCKIGYYEDSLDRAVICLPSGTTADSRFFSTSSPDLGDYICKSIAGCASGYERVYWGKTPVSLDAYKTANNVTYDVQAHSVTGGQIICRTRFGCATGYYDFSCPTGCWGGWLSLWKK